MVPKGLASGEPALGETRPGETALGETRPGALEKRRLGKQAEKKVMFGETKPGNSQGEEILRETVLGETRPGALWLHGLTLMGVAAAHVCAKGELDGKNMIVHMYKIN